MQNEKEVQESEEGAPLCSRGLVLLQESLVDLRVKESGVRVSMH